MRLQNLTVIFIIIIIPIILTVSLYISQGTKTITYQSAYDQGLLTATYDAIYAFELNTTNDAYSNNAETKRNILKSSVKMFEKSLCNTCGISSYNTAEIEEYVPAIVFGMYDGFYMYAPSLNIQTGKYEHNLKNYVYYSEVIDDDNGVIIIYSLDNYVTLSGDFGNGYETKSGYLIVNREWNDSIDTNNIDANKYLNEGKEFTTWFNSKIRGYAPEYFKINSGNNPEDPNSAFVQHKQEVIKNKMESVLNSSITAYSSRLGNYNFKMPKLSEEDWQKIYSNISMVTFFQGKRIGLTKYNGYCVLNSTNSNEYVNPNLMYFIKDEEYHDIRCEELENLNTVLKGYKIGGFQKKKVEDKDDSGNTKLDSNGNVIYKYIYNDYAKDKYACYKCINGSINSNQTAYEYVKNSNNNNLKKSYYTSLARERYNTVKLLDQ